MPDIAPANIWIAVLLTTLAGLSTGIGSALAFLATNTNFRFISVATGFSAGVMLYVSFTEILDKAGASLASDLGERMGNWVTVLSFFAGIAVILLIDRFIPDAENPHEVRTEGQVEELHGNAPPHIVQANARSGAQRADASHPEDARKLLRMGVFTALAIGIHNFPEGLARSWRRLMTRNWVSQSRLPIALHNIPEGIQCTQCPSTTPPATAKPPSVIRCVRLCGAVSGPSSVSCCCCPSSPPPVGRPVRHMVAGIMVYFSLDQLLPHRVRSARVTIPCSALLQRNGYHGPSACSCSVARRLVAEGHIPFCDKCRRILTGTLRLRRRRPEAKPQGGPRSKCNPRSEKPYGKSCRDRSIGEAYAQKLEAAGVTTIEKLLEEGA